MYRKSVPEITIASYILHGDEINARVIKKLARGSRFGALCSAARWTGEALNPIQATKYTRRIE